MNCLMIKGGAIVSARHFDREMILVWPAILELSPQMDGDSVVVTSGADSHSIGLHPHFRALDIRTKNITAANLVFRRESAQEWVYRLQRRLGSLYDVVLELDNKDPDADHIHIEYDPSEGS